MSKHDVSPRTEWWRVFQRPAACLHYPLYLPGRSRDIEVMLQRGDAVRAIAELTKLASLGSGAAKTVLAYLHLQGALPSGVDFDRAADLLREPVASGDPYALYVAGWIHFLRDKDAGRAVSCWVAGEEKGFLPSIIELGRFLSWDLPGSPPRYADAIEKLKLADRLGHKQAASLIATLDAAGARGPLLAISGKFRKVVHFVRLYCWLRTDFFSERVFSRPLQQRRPFFSPEAWTSSAANKD